MSDLEVRREGDWLRVIDPDDGSVMGSAVVGFGLHAPAAVYVAAALLRAVSEGMHESPPA